MKEKILCIEWEDAAYNSGYYDKKTPDDFTPVKTRTVGHLVERKSKAIILSTDRFYKVDGKVDDNRHISIIPKKMITKITELK